MTVVHPALVQRLRMDCMIRPDPLDQFCYVYSALVHHTPAYSPLSTKETALSASLILQASRHFGGVWFHGGRAGLAPGDTVLSVTAGAVRNHDVRPRPRSSYHLVYLTQSRALAQTYANAVGGAVYRVEPGAGLAVAPFILRAFGLLEAWNRPEAMLSLLPECLLEFSCKSARVVEICGPTEPLFSLPDRSQVQRVPA